MDSIDGRPVDNATPNGHNTKIGFDDNLSMENYEDYVAESGLLYPTMKKVPWEDPYIHDPNVFHIRFPNNGICYLPPQAPPRSGKECVPLVHWKLPSNWLHYCMAA